MNTNATLSLTSLGPITPRGRRAWLRMAVSASLMLLGTVPALQAGDTTRVSVDSAGVEGNGFSTAPSISSMANGRYVAFQSDASNLVPGDGNGLPDVFLYDRQSGKTVRVSVGSAGAEGNNSSFAPSISADSINVAFSSAASNLVPGDGNGATDVFVHNRLGSVTTRVSVDSNGAEGNGQSALPDITGSGQYVSFVSFASNLVPGDANGVADIFVHDVLTGPTTRVSVGSGGVEANGGSQSASISANTGRYVAFASVASNLVSGDGNGLADVFVHDRQTGRTVRVSVSSAGAEGNGGSARPSISDNGRYVAFVSGANNLVPGDGNLSPDIFVRDLQLGLTTRVSVDSAGAEGNSESDFPSISGSGLFVAFYSNASNLVQGDGNGQPDIFVYDRNTGLTTRESVDSSGAEGNDQSTLPSITANGRHVAFESFASNLVPADGNAVPDCFVHIRTGQSLGATTTSH